MEPKERYSALVELWVHQNSTQYQWPSVILAAAFVAVSLLVEKKLVASLIDSSKWGIDSEAKYTAGIPLLVIGAGTLIMVYIMRRHRKVLRALEVELTRLDPSFRNLVHPKGLSGSILLRGFLAVIAMASFALGILFFAGARWYIVLALIPTTALGIYFCRDDWTKRKTE